MSYIIPSNQAILFKQVKDSDEDARSAHQSCSKSSSSNKKVRFHGKVKVVLIPSLSEYIEEDLHKLLWWKIEDFHASLKDSTTTTRIN